MDFARAEGLLLGACGPWLCVALCCAAVAEGVGVGARSVWKGDAKRLWGATIERLATPVRCEVEGASGTLCCCAQLAVGESCGDVAVLVCDFAGDLCTPSLDMHGAVLRPALCPVL